MPKIGERSKGGDKGPDLLGPYTFHGLIFSKTQDGKNGIEHFPDDCPFCGKSGKFSVNQTKGTWKCWSCAEGSAKGGGNVYTFLRCLWRDSVRRTTDKHLEALSSERRILPATMREWGVCKSTITNGWMIPGWSPEGGLSQLYRWVRMSDGTRRVMPTKGLNHQVFHPHGDPKVTEGVKSLPESLGEPIYLDEGPWDGMALWETLRIAGEPGAVFALPSCNVFPEKWQSQFSKRPVRLCFDNDHPKTDEKTGKDRPSAGYAGMKRAAIFLLRTVEEVKYLKWGKDGYDAKLPDGYDVRDFLCPKESNGETKADLLTSFLSKLADPPKEWSEEAREGGGSLLEPAPCDSWEKLIHAWKKAMRWIEGLDRALSVMLAAVLSTPAVGDQLWVKILSAASSGKSTLCEAISVCRKYVYPKSTIRGFHSGSKSKDGDDYSLIDKIRGKTLVTKDGDTLLQSPNLGQILAEARDVYDGTSRSHYRSGAGKDKSNIRTTWILAGTKSLRKIDSSELGERFLDCVIMEDIDETLEDAVLRHHLNLALSEAKTVGNCTAHSQHLPAKTEAMRLTGGYVEYLRENAERLLADVELPEAAGSQCMTLAKFVSYMRARPSDGKHLDEEDGRELSARLLSQLVRLAVCLCVVLNKTEVDDDVMRRVRQTALDTARGKTLDMVTKLYEAPSLGLSQSSVALLTNQTDDRTKRLLRFLKAIGAVVCDRGEGGRNIQRWKLSKKMKKLYESVTGWDDA